MAGNEQARDKPAALPIAEGVGTVLGTKQHPKGCGDSKGQHMSVTLSSAKRSSSVNALGGLLLLT